MVGDTGDDDNKVEEDEVAVVAAVGTEATTATSLVIEMAGLVGGNSVLSSFTVFSGDSIEVVVAVVVAAGGDADREGA